MQIPILNGIYADGDADFRTSYPVNLIPVPKENGISKGYLRPADGIVTVMLGPGKDRGGINWNDVHYRVFGTQLCTVAENGALTIIGDVGGYGEMVRLDYSFEKLIIISGGGLYYSDGMTVTRVIDSDLGNVIDGLWVDGYTVMTDGEFIYSTDINDPASVKSSNYASSEIDPDPIEGLLKLRNEVVAINRYTMETFQNIGGVNFPFARVNGAQVMRGCVGTHAACVFNEAIAFLGGGRNESIAVWIAQNSSTVKISTREIDQILATYQEFQLKNVVVECQVDSGHERLLIHLPDQTLAFDSSASRALEQPVWYFLRTAVDGMGAYQGRNLVWCYNKWWGSGDGGKIGYLSPSTSYQNGVDVYHEFTTQIIYNEGAGAIFHDLELIALPGRVNIYNDPMVWTSYSIDGETWSHERGIKCGKMGDRTKRLLWLQQGSMRKWRIQKFRWQSDAHLSVARLEARLEPLYE